MEQIGNESSITRTILPSANVDDYLTSCFIIFNNIIHELREIFYFCPELANFSEETLKTLNISSNGSSFKSLENIKNEMRQKMSVLKNLDLSTMSDDLTPNTSKLYTAKNL